LLKGPHIALSRFLRQRVICLLLRLGFGCCHVFVLRQATNCNSSLGAYPPRASPASFQTTSTTSLRELTVFAKITWRPDRWCVMQSFERVVAFPDSKVIELLQPHQHLELPPQPYSTSFQRTMRYGLSSIIRISILVGPGRSPIVRLVVKIRSSAHTDKLKALLRVDKCMQALTAIRFRVHGISLKMRLS
jgi:hypothetical protein